LRLHFEATVPACPAAHQQPQLDAVHQMPLLQHLQVA
jgi:hypothetical protein